METCLLHQQNQISPSAIQRAPARPFFTPQASPLSISQPGDSSEVEAERVSEQVVQMKPSAQGFFHPQIITTPSIQRACSQCRQEEEIQRKEEENTQGVSPSPFIQRLPDSGMPLPADTQDFFEQRMGHSFGQVRIHTGPAAAASAGSIQAKAYTTGNHIVFNQGQYDPDSQHGKKLLAHELTHVVQQKAAGYPAAIARSIGDAAAASTGGASTGGGLPASAAPGARRIHADVLSADNPDDFLVRAAADELGVDIRVNSMENMIDQLEALTGTGACLQSLDIYNHANPSIQMVSGGGKTKGADGTRTERPIHGFSLSWLHNAGNNANLNRLRHLFCCNGQINWYGCNTAGIWAMGGRRTDAERSSDAHRYTGYAADIYQNMDEAISHGALENIRFMGPVNAQMWANATCTTLTAATDFTNWTTSGSHVIRTTAHGGTRITYSPPTDATCACDTATGRVSGNAASAADLRTQAEQLRETMLRPYYERYRGALGTSVTLPPETDAERQARETREQAEAALNQQLATEIRTALLADAGFAPGVAPTTADEALRVTALWGLDITRILSSLPTLSSSTAAAGTGRTTSDDMNARQRAAEAALSAQGRETFMQVLAAVQREPYWAGYLRNHTVYVLPDISGTANRYRGFTQRVTATQPDGQTHPVYLIHLNRELMNDTSGDIQHNIQLLSALLVHELSHTAFEGIAPNAMRGFNQELANLIADHPQIAALRGASGTADQRDQHIRLIRQMIYELTGYAEEEIFVHLQQLTHQPGVTIGSTALSGTRYILVQVTEYLNQLRCAHLPPSVLTRIVRNIQTRTAALYTQRIEALPAGSPERGVMEANSRLATLSLRMAASEPADCTR